MRLGLLTGGVASSGGPGTYVTGFARALPRDVEVRVLLIGAKQATWRAREQRKRMAEDLGPSESVAVLARPIPAAARLYNSRLAPLLPAYDILFGRHDVYHQTHLAVDPAVPGSRLVLTLHDLIEERWPDEGRLHPRAGDVLRRAAAVITVSDKSRKDIMDRFPAVSPERLHVVWNGVDHELFHPRCDGRDAGRLAAIGVGGRFLLYVGGLTSRKNVETLLQAYGLLRREEQDLPALVLVGPWHEERLAQHALRDTVLIRGNVAGETIAALMRGAEAVVVPSREEGFGLPVLEAQACGTLVVCSDIPEFREVGGEAPVFVDSSDPKVLAADLAAALRIAPQHLEWRRLEGLRHAAKFSWKRSAEAHARVYEQVVLRSQALRSA